MRSTEHGMTIPWDRQRVQDLLEGPHRLLREEPWAGWIRRRGGLPALYDQLRELPIPPAQRRIFEVLIAQPGATAAEYASALSVHQTTYHRHQKALFTLLASHLESWSDENGRPVEASAELAAEVEPALHQLRPPVADFIGRAGQLAPLIEQLSAALDSGSAALGMLHGMGGVGKTESAFHLAQQLLGLLPDAQIIVELRGASSAPLTPAQALQSILRAFTPSANLPADQTELERIYRSTLHGRRVLLLADDASSAEQVRPLLPPTGSALLITSRQRFTLPGMASMHITELGDEALAMLRGICPRLSEEEARSIAAVCGNLPLALRVSGGILQNNPAMSVTRYLARQGDARSRLALLRDPDDPQLDVQASLILSYQLLTPPIQQAFRALGVLVGSFTTHIAQSVMGIDEGEAEEQLALLLRRNLVLYDPAHERWRLHDLVRALAERLLAEAGEAAEVGWPYSRAVVEILEACNQQYGAGGAALIAGLRTFDSEQPHIEALWRRLLAHHGQPESDSLFPRAALATDRFSHLRYNRAERLAQVEAACHAARRSGDEQRYYRLLNRRGVHQLRLGNIQGALALQEEALPLARKHNDRNREAIILRDIGAAWSDLGGPEHLEVAIDFNMQALEIIRSVKNTYIEAIILNNLGTDFHSLQNYEQSIFYFEQALEAARRGGHLVEERGICNNLGLIYVTQQRPQLALPLLEQALRRAQEIGDQDGEAHALDNLAAAAVQSGDLAHALTLYQQALALFQELGERLASAEVSWAYGHALLLAGDGLQGLTLLRESLAYYQETGHAYAPDYARQLADLERTHRLSS